MVGDIYLGTVEAVLPGIQAAFVNIGAEKSAFLHASDLIEAEDEDEASDHDDDNGDGGGSGAGNGGTRSARRRLPNIARSEEHTSELQSRLQLGCRLLL